MSAFWNHFVSFDTTRSFANFENSSAVFGFESKQDAAAAADVIKKAAKR